MSKKSTVNLNDITAAVYLTETLKISGREAQKSVIEKLKSNSPADGTDKLSIVEKALIYATVKHCNQERKYTNDPYIVHPLTVAKNLSDLGFRAEVIASAILHDTVEDTDATHDEIFEIFGNTVSNFVQFLTDDSDGLGNRKVRKEHDRKRLAGAPAEVQSAKVADLIDNSPSIIRNDPDFAVVYIKEKNELLNSLDKAHPALIEEARQIIDQYTHLSKPA